MEYVVNTSGVCTRQIAFEIDEENKIRNVKFNGGCAGNTKGVASLVEGMDAQEVIKRLRGINCGGRGTSCPDKLATAIEMAINE